MADNKDKYYNCLIFDVEERERKMNKPFSIIYEDFRQELVKLINNSGLPPSVIESILQNYLIEISNVAKNQYRIDKTQYENSLSNNEEKKES